MTQQTDWAEVESLDPARPQSTFDMFGILWRRKWIVVCVMIIGAALGYLYYLQATRIYRSAAQILLVKKDTNPVASGEARHDYGMYGGYQDTLSTQISIVRSPMIVGKAVEKFHLDTLPSLKNVADPVRTVIEGLVVARVGDRTQPDPNVMELWYEGIDPGDCPQILSAVIQSYQDFLGETYQNTSEETVQLISQAKDVLAKQLTEKEMAYQQFRKESPLLWQGQLAANLHETRMVEIERARSLVQVENAQVKARIEAIDKARQEIEKAEKALEQAQKDLASGDKARQQAEAELARAEKASDAAARKKAEGSLDTATKVIEKARQEIEKAMKQGGDRQALLMLAANRGASQTSPAMVQGQETANMHESRMAEIERNRSRVLVENAQLDARIREVEEAWKRGGSPEALALLASRLQSEGPRQERFITAMLEHQQLLEDFGADHPKVKAAEKRLKLLAEPLGKVGTGETVSRPGPAGQKDAKERPDYLKVFLDALQLEVAINKKNLEELDRLFNDERKEVKDFLLVYINALQQEYKIGEQRREEYDRIFNQERQASKELATSQMQEENYKNEITRTRQLYDVVIKRLEEINLVKDSVGGITTQLLYRPSRGAMVRPQAAMVMGLACVLGMMVGFGLAYLVDIADKSFRSPDEIRRQLGLPVIGHIPVIEASRAEAAAEVEEGKSRLARILCTFHQPKGRSAEAYRAVRTSLYFSTHGEGHKVIQITSPNPGDGKTTLAANLAISMADSGKRVVLIDADFRRPRIHKYFDLDSTVGVSSVIAGGAELPDAIKETAVPNLWAMPCGPKPPNPSDLLTSPRFKELIDAVRDRYDFVIVDTPPILAVTDSSVVAPRVDAVLLVVRLTKHARDAATRTTEMLGALGARILGVVVNGIGKTTGYGYGYQRYGYYRYGYGYRYAGYRYGYGYGSSEGNGAKGGYYTEEEPAPSRRSARPKTAPQGESKVEDA